MHHETGLDASEHRVQLFDSSKALADTVSAFLLDALAPICAAHDVVHSKADDILAEFLLGQHDVKPAVER